MNIQNGLLNEDKTQEIEEKCRSWHISPRIMPILRLIYLQGWKISKAAKAHGYNGSYIATVIRRLRAEGYETEIRQVLRNHERENLDNIEKAFWDSLSTLVKAGDVKALRLFAEIRGLAQKQPSVQQNVQFNQLTVETAKDMVREALKEEEED